MRKSPWGSIFDEYSHCNCNKYPQLTSTHNIFFCREITKIISEYSFSCISVRMRLKSVTNIQKITKSMKMVSAAKYAKAEKDLRPARSYGAGAKG